MTAAQLFKIQTYGPKTQPLFDADRSSYQHRGDDHVEPHRCGIGTTTSNRSRRHIDTTITSESCIIGAQSSEEDQETASACRAADWDVRYAMECTY